MDPPGLLIGGRRRRGRDHRPRHAAQQSCARESADGRGGAHHRRPGHRRRPDRPGGGEPAGRPGRAGDAGRAGTPGPATSRAPSAPPTRRCGSWRRSASWTACAPEMLMDTGARYFGRSGTAARRGAPGSPRLGQPGQVAVRPAGPGGPAARGRPAAGRGVEVRFETEAFRIRTARTTSTCPGRRRRSAHVRSQAGSWPATAAAAPSAASSGSRWRAPPRPRNGSSSTWSTPRGPATVSRSSTATAPGPAVVVPGVKGRWRYRVHAAARRGRGRDDQYRRDRRPGRALSAPSHRALGRPPRRRLRRAPAGRANYRHRAGCCWPEMPPT